MQTIVNEPVFDPSSFERSSLCRCERIIGPKYDGWSVIVFSSSLMKNIVNATAWYGDSTQVDALVKEIGMNRSFATVRVEMRVRQLPLAAATVLLYSYYARDDQ